MQNWNESRRRGARSWVGESVAARITALVVPLLLLSCSLHTDKTTMNDHPVELPESTSINLPDASTWPLVACTASELERLRAAWQTGEGPAYDAVAGKVRAADEVLTHDVDFPAEGGQHNQWYQCDVCQLALQTIDDTHHRCPSCERVYSGYPYDQVIYERRHYGLTRDMAVCAWAFALTGEVKYAQRAREILVGYGERYTSYPYHSANQGTRDEPVRAAGGGHVFEQSLNEAVWTHDVASAYDLVRHSDVVSLADHETIQAGLLKPLAASIYKHRAGKNNWQTYHNSAFLYLGGLLGDVEMVREALLDPENGFFHQMKVSVLPGGMWYENSWSYHFYTLTAVERTLETARRLGIDLYQIPQAKDMFTVALDYQMVDGTLPRFGDATTTGISTRSIPSAYHTWRDPAFVVLLPKKHTWETVLLGLDVAGAEAIAGEPGGSAEPGNLLKEGAGHGILRVDGPHGPQSAVLAFGPFGGFHGHFDKLSFVHFALGQELAHDPGRSASQAYRLPVHRNWYRPTISHNAVLVDRISQGEAAGEAELFIDTPVLAAVMARTREAYEGTLQRRLLVLRPGYLLVVDELVAEDGQPRTYDWLYHQYGESVSVEAQMTTADVSEFGTGFEYIEAAQVGQVERHVKATFRVGADEAQILVDAGGDAQILTGTGVGKSVEERIPMLAVTRQGTRAHFAAAIEAVPAGGAGTVRGVEMEWQATGQWLVQVTLADGSQELFAYAADDRARTVEGVDTSARLLCLRSASDGGSVQTLAQAVALR